MDDNPFDSKQSASNSSPLMGEMVDDQPPGSLSHPLKTLFRQPPSIEGIILQVQSQEELPAASMSGSIFGFLRDMIWYVPEQRNRERIKLTSLRIRNAAGEQKDARLEGYLTGANLTLGDKVVLWGWDRKGVLIIRKGYNHTSKSSIVSSNMHSPAKTTLLAIVAIASLATLIYLYFPEIIALFPQSIFSH